MDRLIDQLRDISYVKANSIIRQISGIVDYFSSEDEKNEFISVHANATSAASLNLAQLCREKGMAITPRQSDDSTGRQLTLFE